MIVNKCSEILLAKSKKLYGNYRDNCTVVQRMLEKYKKLYPNISPPIPETTLSAFKNLPTSGS